MSMAARKSTRNDFFGYPVGARRDLDGVITHILFQYRQRGMPVQAVRRAITAKKTIGLKLDRSDSLDIRIVLDGTLEHISDLDDLLEV